MNERLRSTRTVNFIVIFGISFATLCHGFGHVAPFVQRRTRDSGITSGCRMKSEFGLGNLLFQGVAGRRDELESCRAQLLEKVTLNQSRQNRVQVEEILEKLISLNSPATVQDNALVGTWRLLWSSQTADVNPFQLPSKVLGGDCYQVRALSVPSASQRRHADDAAQVLAPGRAENVVTWPSFGATLRGGAASERIGPRRFQLTIDSFTLELGPLRLPLLRITDAAPAVVVRDAPTVRQGSQVVTVSGATGGARVLNQRTGWLEVLYLDAGGDGQGPLRVSRADTGLLYLHQRLPS